MSDEMVRFRDCECPGTPHDGKDGRDDGDRVALVESLNFAVGAKAYRIIVSHFDTTDELAEHLGPVYLEHGVAGWNLVDEGGQPVEFDPAVLLNLPYEQALLIVDAADDKFSQRILSPFLKRIASLLPNGRTANGSTSATPGSRTRSAVPSGRSSRNGSAGSRRSTR